LDSLLSLGMVVMAGIFGGRLAKKLSLPSVTGYLLTGLLIGPSLLGIITEPVLDQVAPINDFALGMIGLSIGGELKWKFLRRHWENFSLLFLGESLLTFALVFSATYYFSGQFSLALILAILGLATAPASILAIIEERKARGIFPHMLMSIVAMDNFLCIIAFSVATTFLNVYFFGAGANSALFLELSYEVGLSVMIGFILGALGAWVTNSISEDRHRQVMLTGIMLLAVGLPRQLGISYLFVTLIAGAIIVNFSTSQRKFYSTLHTIDTPILVLFLTLAGVKLKLGILPQVGLLGVIYILARVSGKIAGARLGAFGCKFLPSSCQNVKPAYRRYIGSALIPQAGVAIGLALLAEQKLPLRENLVVTLVLGTIIFFELIGPIFVERTLDKVESIG